MKAQPLLTFPDGTGQIVPIYDERRKFAAMIMAGMAAPNPTTQNPPPEALARYAVEFADALIAELDKDEG